MLLGPSREVQHQQPSVSCEIKAPVIKDDQKVVGGISVFSFDFCFSSSLFISINFTIFARFVVCSSDGHWACIHCSGKVEAITREGDKR